VSRRLAFVVIACLALLLPARTWAQAALHDVFFDPSAQQVYFVAALSGLSSVLPATGSQHVLLRDGVLFQEADTGFARRIAPQSSTVLTWIQPASPTVRVQWVASANGRWLAWTVIQREGVALVSTVHVALHDGTEAKLITKVSSNDAAGAYPLAITDDGRTLFYSLQPAPDPNTYLAFPVATNVYRLDVATAQATQLPNEPLCPCAAGFSADGVQYVRLPLDADGNGFILRSRALPNGAEVVIPAVENFTHTQAGGVLVSADGARIVYASARGLRPGRSERYTLILADRARATQALLTDALVNGLRPLTFTADGNGVIAVGITVGGTYKLDFASRELRQVSAYNFMGQLTSG
jgi:hypothetical protein